MKTNALLLLIAFVFGPAYADTGAQSCGADIKKYCAGVQPGGGAIDACLGQHAQSLSATCTQYRQDARTKLVEFAAACRSDIRTQCAGVNPGDGRIYVCLKQHESDLSNSCKVQLQPVN